MSFCHYRAGHVLIRIAVDDQAPLTDSRTPPTRIPLRPGLISKLSDQGLGLLGQLEESSKRLNTLLSTVNQKILIGTVTSLSHAAPAQQSPGRHRPHRQARRPSVGAAA
jgi:phospholipid/cholesterol/gamma-HCH transport system substrate-binding protein